jgi:hypothetical protein
VQLADVCPHAPPFSSVFGVGASGTGLLVGVRDRLYLIPPCGLPRTAEPVHQPLNFTDGNTPTRFGTTAIQRDDTPSNVLV